jgi:CTP synthase (UTP-ammonia lyase)
VAGIEGAEHEESAPSAPTLLISKLPGSLVGKTQTVKFLPGSLIHSAYGRGEATEQFACNYGFNPAFRGKIEGSQLKVTGVGPDGELRAVEITGHPFYVATLFLPQISSAPENPHPLVVAYLKAASAFRRSAKKKL